MQTSIDFVEALKTKTGAGSDYALAKTLGVTRQAVSNYRTGAKTFSDEIALKAASLLEIEPGIILAAVHAERAKTEAEKSAWKMMFERLGGVAAMVACGIMLSGFYPAESRASTESSTISNASPIYTLHEVKTPLMLGST